MDSRVVAAPQELFVSFLEVAAPESDELATVVKTFPEECDKDTLKQAPLFCYACQPEKGAVQHFTFVLTDGDGKYKYGFCRYPPDGSLCLCFLSYLPWFDFFYAVLDKVAELRLDGQGELVLPMLKTLSQNPMPVAGERFLVIPEGLESGQAFSFTTPDPQKLPSIPESVNLTEYITNIDHVYILHLFAAMLFERRIIITSSKLSLVSACVHAAASLLYPLNWQHIFIPIMPARLVDYCCAPMPFLVGVHSSVMEKIRKMPLDEVVVLDADANQLEIYHNDLGIIPSDVTNPLKDTLKKHTSALDETVAKAFLDAFVYMIGGYRDALRFREGEQIKFDAMAFIESRPKHMQPFLQKVLHLQQFQQFMMERLHRLNQGQGLRDMFENGITSSSQDSTNYLNKYALWVKSKTKKGFSEISSITSTQVLPSMKTAFSHLHSRTKKGVKGLKQFMNDDKASTAPVVMTIGAPQLESKTSLSVSELLSALPADSALRKQAQVRQRAKRPPPAIRPYSEYRATKSVSSSSLDCASTNSLPLDSPMSSEMELLDDACKMLPPSVAELATGEEGEPAVHDDLLNFSVASIPSRSQVTCLARELFLNFENVSEAVPEEGRPQMSVGEVSTLPPAAGAVLGEDGPSIGEALSPMAAFDPFARSPARSGVPQAGFNSPPEGRNAGSSPPTSRPSRSSVSEDGDDAFSMLARERTQPPVNRRVSAGQDPWQAAENHDMALHRQPSLVHRNSSPSVGRSGASADGGSVHQPGVSSAPRFNSVRSTTSKDPINDRPPMPTPFDELPDSQPAAAPAPTLKSGQGAAGSSDPFAAAPAVDPSSQQKPAPPSIKPYRVPPTTAMSVPGMEFDPLSSP